MLLEERPEQPAGARPRRVGVWPRLVADPVVASLPGRIAVLALVEHGFDDRALGGTIAQLLAGNTFRRAVDPLDRCRRRTVTLQPGIAETPGRLDVDGAVVQRMNRHDRYRALLLRGRLLRPDRGDRLRYRLEGAGRLARAGDRGRRFAICQTLDRSDGGEILALNDTQHDGHGGARRQPGSIAALRIDAVALLDRQGDLVQILGFAAPLMNVLIEPESPAVLIAQTVVAGDEGEHGDEAFPLRQIGEASLVDHVLVGLLAAVENHDHGNRGLTGETAWNEDGVVAGTGIPVRAGRLGELFQTAGIGGRGKPDKNNNHTR